MIICVVRVFSVLMCGRWWDGRVVGWIRILVGFMDFVFGGFVVGVCCGFGGCCV